MGFLFFFLICRVHFKDFVLTASNASWEELWVCKQSTFSNWEGINDRYNRGRTVLLISALTLRGYKDPGSYYAEKSRLLIHIPLPPHFSTAGTNTTCLFLSFLLRKKLLTICWVLNETSELSSPSPATSSGTDAHPTWRNSLLKWQAGRLGPL